MEVSLRWNSDEIRVVKRKGGGGGITGGPEGPARTVELEDGWRVWDTESIV